MKIYGGGLKPCNCGSEALKLDVRMNERFGFAVTCTNCGAMSPWSRLSSVARALWNRGDRQPTIKLNKDAL